MSKIMVDGVLVTPSPGQLAALVATAPVMPRWHTKYALYDRMTDAELNTLDTFLLNAASTRQRRQWNDAQSINCEDPRVVQMASALFGAERAAELLA